MKKAWMLSTACAAVLAMSGIASAQGMNEQHGGKNTPAAAEHGGAAPTHAAPAQMNRNAAPNKSGSAQNMDKNAAPKASAQRDEKMGNEKAGSKMSSEHSTTTQSSKTAEGKDHVKGTERVGEQKSGTMRNEKTSAGAKERSTTGSAPAAEAKLTTEQRTKIRKVVVEEKKIPRLAKVDFNIKVGVKIPRNVHFYPVPEKIITIHPAWRNYRVIFVNDELVLIDPATYEIVYVVTG